MKTKKLSHLKVNYHKWKKILKIVKTKKSNSLKQEISNLKADLMNKEDTDLDENVDD